jgi:hypothetical protein
VRATEHGLGNLAQLLTWLGGTLFGVIALPVLYTNYLEPFFKDRLYLTLILGGIGVLMPVFAKQYMPKGIIRTAITEAHAITPETTPIEPRRALIGLVSTYTPRPGHKTMTLDEIKLALQDLDYEALDLEHSNLMPLITAIKHYPNLDMCWLIATTGEGGSLVSARLIEAYARNVLNLKTVFRLGPPWIVTHPFHPQVTGDVKRLVEAAVKEANRLKIEAKEIVVDITGGTVPMSFGAILACVHPLLAVQYTGTVDSSQIATDPSQPAKLEPFVFRFEHTVQQEVPS